MSILDANIEFWAMRLEKHRIADDPKPLAELADEMLAELSRLSKGLNKLAKGELGDAKT